MVLLAYAIGFWCLICVESSLTNEQDLEVVESLESEESIRKNVHVRMKCSH